MSANAPPFSGSSGSAKAPDALPRLAAVLKERHAAIAASEEKARKALFDNQNQAAYREFMETRARLVAALDDEDLLALAAALAPPLNAEVKDALGRFASSARQGLGIGSVFYYSALLYPDDHQEGEPDNLARLVEKLEKAFV